MNQPQVERALWLCAIMLLAIAAVSGCRAGDRDAAKSAAGESYMVLVRALDDSGKPVPGLQLSAANANLGVTDAQGQKSFKMPGVEGQRVDLVASCPDHYSGPRERPAFLLKHTRDAAGHVSDKPIEVGLTCDAKDHLALIAVQTGQAGLPIMRLGKVLAQTSELGTAHVMLREPVGKTIQLTLDTRGKPDLQPESPTHTFTVTQRDAYSVWDQTFEVEKKPTAAELRKKRKGRAAGAAGSKRKPSRAR